MKVQVKRAFKSYFFVTKKADDRLCMKFSSTLNIVHELEPKKVGIWFRQVDNTI